MVLAFLAGIVVGMCLLMLAWGIVIGLFVFAFVWCEMQEEEKWIRQ